MDDRDKLTLRVIEPRGPRRTEEAMQAVLNRIEWCSHTSVMEARPGQRLLVMPDYPQVGPPSLMVFDMEESVASCRGRHGVIRNVRKADRQDVQYTLVYHFGADQKRDSWWQKNDDGTWDVEFYNTTKTDGPNDRPWRWCGTTVLFSAWQAREAQQKKAARSFRVGDITTFEARGEIYTGTVINITKRVTVLVGHTKWYVPATELQPGE